MAVKNGYQNVGSNFRLRWFCFTGLRDCSFEKICAIVTRTRTLFPRFAWYYPTQLKTDPKSCCVSLTYN